MAKRPFRPGALSKYGNKIASSSNGQSFSSQAERDLYELLMLMERAGEIQDIQVQDHVYLTEARILYIADFKYRNLISGEEEWAEMKGFETDVWRIKRRLWIAGYGPGCLKVYKKSGVRVYLAETINPKLTLFKEKG